jgi:hypothetical protein
MVYLVKTDGKVRAFYSERQMIESGYNSADKTVTDEAFNSNGCYARVINDEIVIGKTQEEIAEEERQNQEMEYKATLEEIDQEAGCGRAFRALIIKMAEVLHADHPEISMFDPEEEESLDIQKIIAAENKAEPIRVQLKPLLQSTK